MVVVASMLTGIPCNIGGIDLISELRRNVGMRRGGVRDEWLKSPTYRKWYFIIGIVVSLGYIALIISM